LQKARFAADIIKVETTRGVHMGVIEDSRKKKIRREAAETLQVYETESNLPVGRIVDMSAKGMKLMGKNPVQRNQIYYLRIPLKPSINGRNEVFVDAECRWCKEDGDSGGYYSGYQLRYPSPRDAELIRALIHRWMVSHSERLNAVKRAARDDYDDSPGFFSRIFGAFSRKNSSYE
jgi:hypothetical protein